MARRVVATTVGLFLFVAGCAEAAPPTLVPETVIGAIPASIWPADPTLITEVECPGIDASLVAQATRCSALLHGDELTIDVVVDDVGKTAVTVEQTLFDVGVVAEGLGDQLRADLGLSADAIVVVCDPMVLVARDEALVDCEADRDGDLIGFEVRLLDDLGNWDLVVTR